MKTVELFSFLLSVLQSSVCFGALPSVVTGLSDHNSVVKQCATLAHVRARVYVWVKRTFVSNVQNVCVGSGERKGLLIVLKSVADQRRTLHCDIGNSKHSDSVRVSIAVAGQGAKDVTQLRDQLRLALTWNRSDVAEEKIFTDTTMWPQGYFCVRVCFSCGSCTWCFR